MGSSRGTIVIVLVAAEIAILTAIFSLIGGRSFTTPGFAANRPAWVRSDGRHEVATLEAGQAPKLLISDRSSRIIIKPSTDGKVHVIDLWSSGARAIPTLRVTRGADGIHVDRDEVSGVGYYLFYPFTTERTEIDVPVAATIEIAKSSGSDITGVQGGVSTHSQYGHIILTAIRGNVEAQSDDGYIEAHDVQGESVTLNSESGHLALIDVAAKTVTALTSDGHISASNVKIDGDGAAARIHTNDGSVTFNGQLATAGHYTIGTDDGRIRLNVPSVNAMTVHARSQDGSIRVDGKRTGSGEGPSNYDATGSAAGSLELATQSGSITITTTGAN